MASSFMSGHKFAIKKYSRTTPERAKYHQESLKIAKYMLYESGFERLDGLGNFVEFRTTFVPQIKQTIDN